MDHHTVAVVSITGTCLDVLGSLYLAYDLLGGQHGPLRLLTRAVTYSVVFGIGYGLGLGLFFGLASGVATGIGGSVSELDCTGFWASDSQSHLPFSSRSAKCSPTLTACVLPSTMQRLAVHGLRVVSFGELWSVLSATWSRPLSVAPSSITWTTPGLLRFAWAW